MDFYEYRLRQQYAPNEPHFLGFDPMEHVRLRPGMYVGSVDSRGLFRLFLMVLEHMRREFHCGCSTRIEVILLPGGTVVLQDDSEGLLTTRWEDSPFTQMEVLLQTTGSYKSLNDPLHYEVPPGVMVGSEIGAANALCSEFQVQTVREGEVWQQTYQAGKAVTPLTHTPLNDPQQVGTRFTFTPDHTIFPSLEQDHERLLRHLRQVAYALPGLRITMQDQRVEPIPTLASFHYPDGIRSRLAEMVPAEVAWHPSLVIQGTFPKPRYPAHKPELQITLALQFTSTPNTVIEGAVNNYDTTEGTHIDALQSGIMQVLQEQDHALTWEQVSRGLHAVLVIHHLDAHFANMTITRLLNLDIQEPIIALVTAAFQQLDADSLARLRQHLHT
jgi:DNA gyrase subunit B